MVSLALQKSLLNPMEPISKALSLKTELDALRPLDPEQEGRIMQKFRLDWNYHSNRLEGNSLTFGETKALILFGITAQGKPLKDHLEIEGHNEAIEWVLDIVGEEYPLTETFIRELHTLLLKESYSVKAITAEGKPITKRRSRQVQKPAQPCTDSNGRNVLLRYARRNAGQNGRVTELVPSKIYLN